MRGLLLVLCSLLVIQGNAQTADSTANTYENAASELLARDGKLLIGGYGEVHYNQSFEGGERHNGVLDVHRMVLLFGYNFDAKTQFISEIEIEHVKEVYVEQAFLQHKLTDFLNFRAGLMLVPMGIINEYHEPTTFNGVERPLTEKYLAPTTWREIGLGINGTFLPVSLKYQLYLMNGFNGYDGTARINGKNGLRNGRQKGAESYISSPSLTGKIEYFGLRGLNLGISGYLGKTQSSLYDGLDRSDASALVTADSSVVGVAMLGLDSRYTHKGLQLRGQLYYTKLSNTEEYNEFTGTEASALNDVGSSMLGYYAEIAYNLLKYSKTGMQLIPFVRYEFADTHHSVTADINQTPAYRNQGITSGITLKLAEGAVLKTDVQFLKNAGAPGFQHVFNAGLGVMF